MDETLIADIRTRLEETREQIALAAQSAGRDPAAVRLVVVTKTHLVERIRAAIQAGVKILGENYAEEAVAKMDALGPGQVEWHMIGHVQSRKANLVAQRFDLMHSLDSLKLANRLDRFSAEAGRTLPVLLEVNVSGEGSKFGYPAWDEAQWPALTEGILQICELPQCANSRADEHAALCRASRRIAPVFRSAIPFAGIFVETGSGNGLG
jgi:PLP dependent protein